MPTPPTVARSLARALAAHASHSFGLMGNGNAHLIEHLGHAGVPYTAVRHEAGTVAAADAYGRVSGRLTIATTTYGAGFTNALTALAEAAQARTPLLLVVGDAPAAGPRPWDVDQVALAAAVGVPTRVLAAEDIAGVVSAAAAEALRERRPVILALPYDLVSAPAGTAVPPTPASTVPPRPRQDEPGLDPAELERALRALAGAERPLILAGRGAHLAGAGPELGRLAARLGALTATSALARGIFPDAGRDLGVTGGFGQPEAMARLAQADVALVVGASLNQFTMRFGDLFGPGTVVIRVDDAAVTPPPSHAPLDHLALRGDARAAVSALADGLDERGHAATGWPGGDAGLEPGGALRRRDLGEAEHADGRCADGRLDPRAVAARLAELLPAERHITTDGGHFIGWSSMFWPVASPERLIMVGTAYQTIGLGFPTVAGVAAAVPDSTVVLSTGDGGGLMALADLETAIRVAPSCVIVVWNDGAYGAEVHLYGALGLDQGPMLIPDADFAGLATALGATGVPVRELADLDALAAWTAAGARGTLLLDCRVSRLVVADFQREIQAVNGVTRAAPGTVPRASAG